jgi:uncharacterized protein
MSTGLIVSRCRNCGAGYFPARLLCPECGGDQLHEDRVRHGIVEDTVTVRHAAGHGEWRPRHLATIRTNEGQAVIAGIAEELPRGTKVELDQDGGAVTAKRTPP